MGINPHALYLDLESDLRSQVAGFNDGVDYPGMSVRTHYAHSLHRSFLKKFKDDVAEDAEQKALDKFLACNKACGEWTPGPYTWHESVLLGGFETAINQFFRRMKGRLGSWHDILDRGRVGPGSSIGAVGSDFYTKLFSSQLTCTSPGLFELYSHWTSHDPRWHDAELYRQDAYGKYCHVLGNRLSFVPKSVDIARTICTEPTLNMYYQLGLGSLLEEELKRSFGINLSTQPDKNRILARRGSLNGTYCTIDLQSASDSISLKMIERFFPDEIVWWLKKLRSPMCELPNGEQVQLNMLSSMGNGFTFPIQTAVFCCVVSSVYELHQKRMVRPRRQSSGNFAVFGDDIIVKNEFYDDTCRLLGLLGFTVNEDKSFNDGDFRESCGSDFYKGQDVRGVYVKSLKTPQHRATVINQLNRWSARTGIYLPLTCRRLMKGLPRMWVPLYENDDAGVKVPLECIEGKKLDPNTQGIIYRRWESKTKYIRLRDGILYCPKGSRQRIYNPDGLIKAALHGCLGTVGIGLRLGPAVYQRKRATSSNWNWCPDDGSNTIEVWRLTTAILFNLMD
jgi:hypothetical protein